jgi:hypothetical protein
MITELTHKVHLSPQDLDRLRELRGCVSFGRKNPLETYRSLR